MIVPSGLFTNLKGGGAPQGGGTFRVYIFKSVQVLAYFSHKNWYNFFTSEGRGHAKASPLNTPLIVPLEKILQIGQYFILL